MEFINHEDWFTVTINTKDRAGLKFVKKLCKVHEHIMSVKPNDTLGRPWMDYTIHQDDYDKCHELFEQQRFALKGF